MCRCWGAVTTLALLAGVARADDEDTTAVQIHGFVSQGGLLTSANNYLPVVDGKNQLVGVVALQDLKEYLGSGEELRGIIAYDIMR